MHSGNAPHLPSAAGIVHSGSATDLPPAAGRSTPRGTGSAGPSNVQGKGKRSGNYIPKGQQQREPSSNSDTESTDSSYRPAASGISTSSTTTASSHSCKAPAPAQKRPRHAIPSSWSSPTSAPRDSHPDSDDTSSSTPSEMGRPWRPQPSRHRRSSPAPRSTPIHPPEPPPGMQWILATASNQHGSFTWPQPRNGQAEGPHGRHHHHHPLPPGHPYQLSWQCLTD